MGNAKLHGNIKGCVIGTRLTAGDNSFKLCHSASFIA
jgi:hypothetical protein